MARKEIVWAGRSLKEELEAMRERDKQPLTFEEELQIKEKLKKARKTPIKEENKDG